MLITKYFIQINYIAILLYLGNIVNRDACIYYI